MHHISCEIARRRRDANLSDLLSLLFPLCAILILLDRAKKEVDLGNDNFCDVGSSWTVGAWACASAKGAVVRAVR